MALAALVWMLVGFGGSPAMAAEPVVISVTVDGPMPASTTVTSGTPVSWHNETKATFLRIHSSSDNWAFDVTVPAGGTSPPVTPPAAGTYLFTTSRVALLLPPSPHDGQVVVSAPATAPEQTPPQGTSGGQPADQPTAGQTGGQPAGGQPATGQGSAPVTGGLPATGQAAPATTGQASAAQGASGQGAGNPATTGQGSAGGAPATTSMKSTSSTGGSGLAGLSAAGLNGLLRPGASAASPAPSYPDVPAPEVAAELPQPLLELASPSTGRFGATPAPGRSPEQVTLAVSDGGDRALEVPAIIAGVLLAGAGAAVVRVVLLDRRGHHLA